MGGLVFPGAVCGSDPDPLRQVDEVVERMHEELGRRGLGIGAMLQHTLFVKAKVVDPLAVLGRFHPAAYALAPQLRTLKSAGTIIQVPGFPDSRAAVMLEVIAGGPLSSGPGRDGYTRIPFEYGPPELSETVGDGRQAFTAGIEGLDFEHNELALDLDGQVATVVDKLLHAATSAGVTLKHMIQYNLYVTVGNDTLEVRDKLHAEMARREPGVGDHPAAGTVMVVDGMAVDAFRLEMDAVFAGRSPGAPMRVRRGRPGSTQSVANGDLVFVSALPGADLDTGLTADGGLDAQLDAAARNVAAALESQGSSLDKLLKYRLLLKRGAVDAGAARVRFAGVLADLAPALEAAPPAETVLVVEDLLGGWPVQVAVIAAR